MPETHHGHMFMVMDAKWKVREIAAGEFKAKCLQLMDEVQEEGIELVITKRGKPVAKLVPADAEKTADDGWGCMKGRVKFIDADWWKSDPNDWPMDDNEEW